MGVVNLDKNESIMLYWYNLKEFSLINQIHVDIQNIATTQNKKTNNCLK